MTSKNITSPAAHRALRQRLHGAFAPVMDGSAPPRFEAEVVDLSEKRFSRDVRTGWLGAPQWLAMAATLVLGLAVGRLADLRPEGPIESHNGTIIAAASLDQALNQQLASAGPADGIRIGLTFRDQKGAICRSFSGAAGNGLACRGDGGEWRVEGLFASPSQGGEYRMAAGESPQIATLIDQRIAGEPFDAAQERAAFEQGWQ